MGFRLSARAVLLRLVSGPVTNHDSSARERRGHTTLGSGSGACCHPLSPCPRRQPGRSTLPHGEPPSRAIIALRNKERRVRALGARFSEGPGCSCRCLIFATNTTLRPVASRLVASSSFCLLFLSMSSKALACCRLCFCDVPLSHINLSARTCGFTIYLSRVYLFIFVLLESCGNFVLNKRDKAEVSDTFTCCIISTTYKLSAESILSVCLNSPLRTPFAHLVGSCKTLDALSH